MSDEEKRTKKLSKGIVDGVAVFNEKITGAELRYPLADLSDVIKEHLVGHGLLQKLGDAAAGKEGQEAVDSINKVWEGLVKGDWTVRAPAAEKVTKKSIMDTFNAMPDGQEKEILKSALSKMGFKF